MDFPNKERMAELARRAGDSEVGAGILAADPMADWKKGAREVIAALASACLKLRTALDALRPFPLVVEPVAAALIAEADKALQFAACPLPPAVMPGREEIARTLKQCWRERMVRRGLSDSNIAMMDVPERDAAFNEDADRILSLTQQSDGWREIVERCAQIAEGWPATFDGPVSSQGHYAAENIAAAIRALPSPPQAQEKG